jgi:predicted metal-dependent HD superfamily phosphohydrolase
VTTHQVLSVRWAALIRGVGGYGAVEFVGAALIAAWGHPSRKYHDLTHLQTVLDGIDDLAAHAADPLACELAAWYHDAVYEGLPDDEERSARQAERDLPGLGLDPARIAEVARLVRLTVGHDPAPDDRNGAVLCDADLAILAAAPQAYAAYARAVRAEYAHVEDAAFRTGRAAVLRRLLDLPELYRTPFGHAHWEGPARANLGAELAELACIG